MTDERTRALLGWLGRLVTVTLEDGKITEGELTPRMGFIKDTSESGTEYPACLLGVRTCGESYMGKVISVLRHKTEEQDRLIVAPVGREMYEPWIRVALIEAGVDMEEGRLFCLYEKSCGVIPYRIRERGLEYLALFQSGSSTWSFPKGHMEYGEDEVATARREVAEEIGVEMDITTDFRCEIFYSVHNKRSKKKVVLFAVPFDGEIKLRDGEIGAAKWLRRGDVQKLFRHKELRGIFNRLERTVAIKQKKSD